MTNTGICALASLTAMARPIVPPPIITTFEWILSGTSSGLLASSSIAEFRSLRRKTRVRRRLFLTYNKVLPRQRGAVEFGVCRAHGHRALLHMNGLRDQDSIGKTSPVQIRGNQGPHLEISTEYNDGIRVCHGIRDDPQRGNAPEQRLAPKPDGYGNTCEHGLIAAGRHRGRCRRWTLLRLDARLCF